MWIIILYMSKIENKTIVSNGISFGSALAIAISFTLNKSVMWAIIHGIFSWLYVIYYLLFVMK